MQTFEIDLEKIFHVSGVLLVIQQEDNVTIDKTIEFGTNTSIYVQEPHAKWLLVSIFLF